MKAFLAWITVAAVGTLLVSALLQALKLLHALRDGSPQPANHARNRDDPARTKLRDERDRLLNHLREIRFDFQTGKLDAKDFHALSDRYALEAAQVLDALERVDAPAGHGTGVRT